MIEFNCDLSPNSEFKKFEIMLRDCYEEWNVPEEKILGIINEIDNYCFVYAPKMIPGEYNKIINAALELLKRSRLNGASTAGGRAE